MSVTHQDRWRRWHDKPCNDGEPSSNNGWLYTAYAKKLGLAVDNESISNCYFYCWHKNNNLRSFMTRSPEKETPPMSRDEVLGVVGCGLMMSRITKDWSFCPYGIPSFNIIKTIGALWRMRSSHRNALWENGGEPHLFRFAFSVPLQDRGWILRQNDMHVPLSYKLYEALSVTIPTKSNSSKLIEWFKYDIDPGLDVFQKYFGENHPITEAYMKMVLK